MPPPPRPRLGLFVVLDRSAAVPAAWVYWEALDLIAAAEALGYHAARVAQHHFGQRSGRLPSPLALRALERVAREVAPRLGVAPALLCTRP